MTPVKWDRMVQLFHQGREKSGDARDLLLDAECGGDLSLRNAVEELLKEDELASGFLSDPLLSVLLSPVSSGVEKGQQFGHYTTTAFLGRGGMGEVWSAHDNGLNRPVALKFLRSEATLEMGAAQLTQEALVASALNHPGIVTVYELAPHPGGPILVMELVDGVPLTGLGKSPLPLKEIVSIGGQIADALATAHANGIIHHDLKPDNILMRRDGIVKVLDFGLACKVTTETIAAGSMRAGTLSYMSPEQARGEALTPLSDVFSFGLVLFELATGRHAFPGSGVETVGAILHQPSARPSSVNPRLPPAFDALVGSMLAKDPAARPSMRHVAETLRDLDLVGRLSRRWLVAAACTILALTAATAGLLSRNRQIASAPNLEQITWAEPEARLTAGALSPSGSFFAYANAEGVSLRVSNGETRPLAAPKNFTIDNLAWFTDESRLVASGFSTESSLPAIWIVSAKSAPPELLRENGRLGVPSPDGTSVAFISWDRSEIWSIKSGATRRIRASTPGATFSLLVWMAGGRRLGVQCDRVGNLFGVKHSDSEVDHIFESIDPATGRTLASSPDLWIAAAAPVHGDRLIYMPWEQLSRSRFREANSLWEVNIHESTGGFAGKPRIVLGHPDANPQGSNHLRGVSASADGREVVVVRTNDTLRILAGDFDLNPPRISGTRRATFDLRNSYPHSWTIDGKAIVFESLRNGAFDIFKQPLGQRTPQALSVSADVKFSPEASPDGHWVLYSQRIGPNRNENTKYKLMRVSVEGGPAVEVPIGGLLDEFHCATIPGRGCVIRTTEGHQSFVFWELDPVAGKGKELARTIWSESILGDWALSADASEAAIPHHSSHDARIRFVNLRPNKRKGADREEIAFSGLAQILGLHYSTKGQGWFTTVDTSIGVRLLFLLPDGSFHPLGDIQGWAIPSPDGNRVAFLDSNAATNAWLFKMP